MPVVTNVVAISARPVIVTHVTAREVNKANTNKIVHSAHIPITLSQTNIAEMKNAPELYDPNNIYAKMRNAQIQMKMNYLLKEYTEYEDRQINIKLLYILYIDSLAIACLFALIYYS